MEFKMLYREYGMRYAPLHTATLKHASFDFRLAFVATFTCEEYG